MTRFSDTTMEAAGAERHVAYVLLAEFDFASGFVRVNSGDRYYTHESHEFAPLGTFAGIGSVRENGDLIPEKVEYMLSAVNNSLITTALTENYHNRDARLWAAYLNPMTYELAHTPRMLREERMDVMTIRREQNNSLISQICESRLIRWNHRADLLYSLEHQKLFDSTDNFFNRVATLPNTVVKWRGEKVIVGGGGGGGGTPRGQRQEV